MKVFIVQNIQGEIFNVKNKIKFCEKFGITPRLLDYTIKGSSKTRYQEWHKQFKIKDIVNFVESEDGDKVLWDSNLKGYFLKSYKEEDNKETETEPLNNQSFTAINSNKEEIESLQKELIKTHRQKQKLQDQLNLNKKIMREQFRYENMCELVINNCKDYLRDGVPTNKHINNYKFKNSKAILTLSDFHLGEKVEETNNYFDSEVAQIRTENIFKQFEKEVDMRKIDEVYILMLGDFIFSQDINRSDMKLSGEFPEIQSAIKCFNILSSVIDKLVIKYKVNISGVIGNESRFNSHYHTSTLQKEARNNIDTLIFEMLRNRYENNHNINFIGDCDVIEDVISIGGKSFLMTHGHQKYMNHKDLDKTFVNIKARLEPIYGEIDFMVLGHIHSTLITDRIARNSSLVGSNSYSNELGFPRSFVSQNMIIIEDDSIKTIPLRVV